MKTYLETVDKLARAWADSYFGGDMCPGRNIDFKLVSFIYDVDEGMVYETVKATSEYYITNPKQLRSEPKSGSIDLSGMPYGGPFSV